MSDEGRAAETADSRTPKLPPKAKCRGISHWAEGGLSVSNFVRWKISGQVEDSTTRRKGSNAATGVPCGGGSGLWERSSMMLREDRLLPEAHDNGPVCCFMTSKLGC